MSSLTLPAQRGVVKMKEHNKLRKSIDELALIYRVLYGRPSQEEREKLTLSESTFYSYGESFEKFLENNSDRIQIFEGVPNE